MKPDKINAGTIPDSPQDFPKPLTAGRFRFLAIIGDTKGDTAMAKNYRPAKLSSPDKGKWFCYFFYRNPQTGKFDRFKVYEGINRVKDRTERLEYAKDLIWAVNEHLRLGYNPFEKPTLTISVKNWTLYQALNYFKQKLPERNMRKKSDQTYGSTLKLLYELPNVQVNELSKDMCKTFLHKQAEKKSWSNRTYNNNLSFARIIFTFLQEAEIVEKNPFKLIKKLPVNSSRHRPYDQKTFEKILLNADDDLKEFILFLYNTGVRENEARQLEYEHVLRDRTKPVLFIPGHISKNKRDDYVPITKEFADKYQGTGKIFGTSRDHYGKRFTALKKKLKLHKDYTLYSVKHTKAIHLVEAEVPPFSIMKFFRHTSIDTTMIYLRSLGLDIGREALKQSL